MDVETTSENHCDIVQNITQSVDSLKIETLQPNQVRFLAITTNYFQIKILYFQNEHSKCNDSLFLLEDDPNESAVREVQVKSDVQDGTNEI